MSHFDIGERVVFTNGVTLESQYKGMRGKVLDYLGYGVILVKFDNGLKNLFYCSSFKKEESKLAKFKIGDRVVFDYSNKPDRDFVMYQGAHGVVVGVTVTMDGDFLKVEFDGISIPKYHRIHANYFKLEEVKINMSKIKVNTFKKSDIQTGDLILTRRGDWNVFVKNTSAAFNGPKEDLVIRLTDGAHLFIDYFDAKLHNTRQYVEGSGKEYDMIRVVRGLSFPSILKMSGNPHSVENVELINKGTVVWARTNEEWLQQHKAKLELEIQNLKQDLDLKKKQLEELEELF